MKDNGEGQGVTYHRDKRCEIGIKEAKDLALRRIVQSHRKRKPIDD